MALEVELVDTTTLRFLYSMTVRSDQVLLSERSTAVRDRDSVTARVTIGGVGYRESGASFAQASTSFASGLLERDMVRARTYLYTSSACLRPSRAQPFHRHQHHHPTAAPHHPIPPRHADPFRRRDPPGAHAAAGQTQSRGAVAEVGYPRYVVAQQPCHARRIRKLAISGGAGRPARGGDRWGWRVVVFLCVVGGGWCGVWGL